MKYIIDYFSRINAPLNLNCTHATLQLHASLNNYLSQEDAAAVVDAHQILFPRSSPYGVERIIRLAQRLLSEEEVGFHNIDEHYPYVKSKAIRSLMYQEKGYAALLLAGTLEHIAQEDSRQAHQHLSKR